MGVARQLAGLADRDEPDAEASATGAPRMNPRGTPCPGPCRPPGVVLRHAPAPPAPDDRAQRGVVGQQRVMSLKRIPGGEVGDVGDEPRRRSVPARSVTPARAQPCRVDGALGLEPGAPAGSAAADRTRRSAEPTGGAGAIRLRPSPTRWPRDPWSWSTFPSSSKPGSSSTGMSSVNGDRGVAVGLDALRRWAARRSACWTAVSWTSSAPAAASR